MIIGVLSDTHGNRKLMHAVADRMRDEHGAQLLLHLGDDYADAEELALSAFDVVAVPGLWCSEYQSTWVKNTRIEEIEGLTIAMAHADQDLRGKERRAAVWLTGHTHSAKIERRGKSVHFNPGHLKSHNSRGERASYGLIEITGEAVVFSILDFDGTLREQERFKKDELRT